MPCEWSWIASPSALSRAQLAKALGPKLEVGPESLHGRVVQSQADAGQKDGPITDELEELKALRAEVRDLKETNEILKRASNFLSSGCSTLAPPLPF